MTDNPSLKEIEKELHEAENDLQTLQTEWLETLEDLAAAKEETKNQNIFATIDYLTFCDQLCKSLSLDIKDMDADLARLLKMRTSLHQNGKNIDFIENLISETQDLRNSQQKKMQNIDDEYAVLAERVLRQSEDLIVKYAEAIEQEKMTPPLMAQINQNLEKELFLQELKDSLETYREAREELIAELTAGSTFQMLPEDIIAEDLGEEKPEIDSILSQLDTLITSCDMALLNKEIQD